MMKEQRLYYMMMLTSLDLPLCVEERNNLQLIHTIELKIVKEIKLSFGKNKKRVIKNRKSPYILTTWRIFKIQFAKRHKGNKENKSRVYVYVYFCLLSFWKNEERFVSCDFFRYLRSRESNQEEEGKIVKKL